VQDPDFRYNHAAVCHDRKRAERLWCESFIHPGNDTTLYVGQGITYTNTMMDPDYRTDIVLN
jgi:hypothetical protein